jgi:hypothetical protein
VSVADHGHAWSSATTTIGVEKLKEATRNNRAAE